MLLHASRHPDGRATMRAMSSSAPRSAVRRGFRRIPSKMRVLVIGTRLRGRIAIR